MFVAEPTTRMRHYDGEELIENSNQIIRIDKQFSCVMQIAVSRSRSTVNYVCLISVLLKYLVMEIRASDILCVVNKNYAKLNLNYSYLFANVLQSKVETTDSSVLYEKLVQLYEAHVSSVRTIILFSSRINIDDIIDGLEKDVMYIYIKPLYSSHTLCDALILKDYYELFYYITKIVADNRIRELQQDCVACMAKIFEHAKSNCRITIVSHLQYNQVNEWLSFVVESEKRLEHVCE